MSRKAALLNWGAAFLVSLEVTIKITKAIKFYIKSG
jgi:hypothetical protein